MSDIQIRLRIEDDDDLAVAEALAEADGIELQQAPAPPGGEIDEQIAPIAAVLIGAGVLAAATFITDWWERRKESRRGGLVIDQRPSAKDDIYRDEDLTYGWVVVYPKDGGEVKVDVKDAPKAAVERWVSEVISGAYKTVNDLAKLISEKPPADKVKVVESSA